MKNKKKDIKTIIMMILIVTTLLISGCSANNFNSKNRLNENDAFKDRVPYKYLESRGVSIFYETDNLQAYNKLLPDVFEMPEKPMVYAFINDFYKLDYNATPYKENALMILAKYNGELIWHCIYMPVTDENSLIAGKIGLGLPKTMGEINFTQNDNSYSGIGIGENGGKMELGIDLENFNIDSENKQEIIRLSELKKLSIRNGEIIEIGKTKNKRSKFEVAEKFPEHLTIKFGEVSISTNTDLINVTHPLDLKASKIIGGYYVLNKVSFGLTGDSY